MERGGERRRENTLEIKKPFWRISGEGPRRNGATFELRARDSLRAQRIAERSGLGGGVGWGGGVSPPPQPTQKNLDNATNNLVLFRSVFAGSPEAEAEAPSPSPSPSPPAAANAAAVPPPTSSPPSPPPPHSNTGIIKLLALAFAIAVGRGGSTSTERIFCSDRQLCCRRWR